MSDCIYINIGAQFFSTAYFGERYGPIILDNLTCTGSESNLLGCSGNAIGDNVCTHSQDAGVRCPGLHLVDKNHFVVINPHQLFCSVYAGQY